MSEPIVVEDDLTLILKSRSFDRDAEGAIPFWGDVPEAWDNLTVAGIQVPGIAMVTGRVGQRWDTRTTPGKSGVRFVTLGYEAAKVRVTIVLWTAAHLKAFEQLVRRIRPKFESLAELKGSRRTAKFDPRDAISLEHPAISLYGIKAVVVTELGFPEMKGPGVYEVDVECIEYVGQDKFRENKGSGVSTTGKIGPSLSSFGKGKLGERVEQANKPSDSNTGPNRNRGASGSWGDPPITGSGASGSWGDDSGGAGGSW